MKQYTYNLRYERKIIGTYNVVVMTDHYQQGNALYLGLKDADNEEHFMDITVNVPGTPLAPDEILVKNYSENEGMAEWLVANGIADMTGRTVDSGYVTVPIMKLKPEFIAEHNLS